MPSTVKSKGIILKIKDTPGRDKLIYILTDSGLIKAFMTPKRSAGKKSYTFDLFTYGEIVYYMTDSGNCLINSITPLEYFYGIRNDVVSLYCAGYISALSIHISQDVDADIKTLFDFLYKSLNDISNGTDIKRIKPVFEIKAVQLLGFTPCLEADKKSNVYYFDFNDGRLFDKPRTGCVYMPRTVVMCIYNVLRGDTDTAFDTCLNGEEQDIFYDTAQQYLLYHTERNFEALDYLNGVI